MEDCRDYLRTGRCKYGASCKYNHPENVQNGGGIKPLDPSEPLFPSRPNEPVCQYFMKHGTCKFGQACKFDHPPQHAMQFIDRGGQGGMMNVGHLSEPSLPHLVLNQMGTDTNGMILQFLPQRVDEPDCIYFLKNGRCKYGATCRYHHPIQPQLVATRRLMENKPKVRTSDVYNARSGQKVQYVTQIIPNYHGGQHVMTSYDNKPVGIVTGDPPNGLPPGYQIITGSDGVTSYCVPAGSVVVTEQGSSSSSIASSSYETAQDQLSEQWSRARRNSSGGSLMSYSQHNDGRPPRTFLSHSISEGNIVQRQARSTSYGSAGEMAAVPQSFPRTVSNGSWQPRTQGSHIPARQEPSSRPPVAGNGILHQRRMIMRRRDARGGEVPDEGFTMMTSALLNMLDTPEERSADSYSEEEYRQRVADDGVQSELGQSLFEQMTLHDQGTAREVSPQGGDTRTVQPAMFDQRSMHATYMSANQRASSSGDHEDIDSSWSPTWLGPADPSNGFAMLHHKPGMHRSSSHQDSDVGLYLG
jgi:Zinc finger C-x8-C-x5-C-x3-H type (and similar)